MTETIQAALSPLLIIGSFCGLSFFECSPGRLRSYLSYLYFLTVWSLFAYLYYYLIYSSNVRFIYLNWLCMTLTLATIVSILDRLFHFKRLKTCLRNFSMINDTLEVLGIPKEYRRVYNWIIRLIIIWIVPAFFMNMFAGLWFNYDFNIIIILAPFVGNYLFQINSFNSLTGGIILGYIGSRFQRINEYICYLLENNAEYIERRNKLIIVNQRRREAKKCKQHLWIIMHVHLQLCFISRELNKIFSISMTLQMTIYFVFSVLLSYEIYMTHRINHIVTVEHVLYRLYKYAWVAIFNAQLLALNYICQIVCDKANETIVILYKLSNNSFDIDLREQTLQFILQIKRKELKFSGMGLCYFGYNFIRKFYVSVLTVLLLIIQVQEFFKYKPIKDEN